MIECRTTTPRQTAAVARRFAAALPPPPLHLHLRGELGAGKTLWARALIAALGGASAPSPSFALALSYPLPAMPVHHLDLFRLPIGAPLPEELRELLDEDALCLIEWPERASDIPAADIRLSLDFSGTGRRLAFAAESARGGECLQKFSG
ncbi:MAG: tRNA (adenosine(37)-N6)-threonylcarbamoyltransferase complex ATPase subunit type 1 TsaE [Gammaproteobacteria bacterium]